MKITQRILSMALALVLVLALAIPGLPTAQAEEVFNTTISAQNTLYMPYGMGPDGGIVGTYANGGYGAHITFPCDIAQAGTYNLKLNQAFGRAQLISGKGETIYLSVYDNGNFVQELSFPITGDWGLFAEIPFTMNLSAGRHYITFWHENTNSCGGPNIDYLSLQLGDGAVTKLEAEQVAGYQNGGMGWNGASLGGFFTNRLAAARFTVANVPKAGYYDVTLTFQNGNPEAGNRDAKLAMIVNGSYVQDTLLPPQANWGVNATKTERIYLNAGTNTIRYWRFDLTGDPLAPDASGAQAAPNLLSLNVTAHVHTPNAGVVTPPTCNAEGYTTYTCTDPKCGETWKDDIVPAAHKWDEGVVIKEPTYSEKGLKRYTCTVDSSHTKEEEFTYPGLGNNDAMNAHNDTVTTFDVSTAGAVMEAENALWFTLNPGKPLGVDTSHGGYSGTGFMGGFWTNPGAAIEYPMNVKDSGIYTLTLRYANGGNPAAVGIYLDDQLVEKQNMENSGGWNQWAEYKISIELTAANKKLSIMAEEGTGDFGINPDCVTLFYDSMATHNKEVTPFVVNTTPATVMEAENATWITKDPGKVVGISTDHPGYSGTGFVGGFWTNPGAAIEYPLTVKTGGIYAMTLRYANGGEPAAVGIYLDGQLIEKRNMENSGGWNQWAEYQLDIDLTTANKKLSVVAEAGTGSFGINPDCVTLNYNAMANHNKDVAAFDVSANQIAVMEAENATWITKDPGKQVGVSADHPGYSGAGFVAGFWANPGAAIEYPLNVKDNGIYTMVLRYANGDIPAAVGIYLDGKLIEKRDMENSGGWNQWAEYKLDIDLTTANKKLSVVAEAGAGAFGINPDCVTLKYNTMAIHNQAVTPVTLSPYRAVVFEAENALWMSQNIYKPVGIDTVHKGYTGTGFVAGLWENPGAEVAFPINVIKDGTYLVTLRYANGSIPAAVGIYLDGELVEKCSFKGTGGWNKWGYYKLNVNLSTDNKVLSVVAEPGTGVFGVNLDSATFELNKMVAHNITVKSVDVSLSENVVFEAEDAVWTTENLFKMVGLNNEHAGYSGIGFVAGLYDNPGSSVIFPINVTESGEYTINLRYANGDRASTVAIYVDGELIEMCDIPVTGGWTKWGTYSIKTNLTPEDRSITVYMAHNGKKFGINLDSMIIGPDVLDAQNETIEPLVVLSDKESTMEAESARMFSENPDKSVGVDTSHIGYNGAGFVAGLWDNPGSGVEFPLNVQEDGTYTLALRYANGEKAARISIYLDDMLVEQGEISSTGSWGNWANHKLDIELTTDNKVLSMVMEATDEATGINLDSITLTPHEKEAPAEPDAEEETAPAFDPYGNSENTNVTPAKNNTWIVFAGIGILLLIVALVVLLKRKKSGRTA